MNINPHAPLAAWSLSICLIHDRLQAMLEAIDDPNIDCEETMRVVRERAFEARGQSEMMRAALEADLE